MSNRYKKSDFKRSRLSRDLMMAALMIVVVNV